MNTLYFGDNLEILRRSYIPNESVDLIYLDPPFKSNRAYNLLFKERDGSVAAAQIKAFGDTWRWDAGAEAACQAMIKSGGAVGSAMLAMYRLLGPTDMMAYLAMMAPRLVELRRVLKPSGAIYLHCDPTADQYLRILLDTIFEPPNFRSEIIWKRTSAHSSARRYGPIHDVILYYSKGPKPKWNRLFQPYDDHYMDAFYTHHDADGRRWRRSDLTGAGIRHGETGRPWRGIDVTEKGRHWFVPPAQLDRLDAAGKIHWPAKADGVPMLKRYADEQRGVPLQDVWTDIPPLHNLAAERIGFPTQKPVSLLKRIIQSSTSEGDVVLDPFCGCGTAIIGAEQLKRQWIGIDVTHVAIDVVQKRLRRDVGDDVVYRVHSEPKALPDAIALAKRDRLHFQTWALGLVGARVRDARPGADRGIDGRLYDEHGRMAIVSVKSGKPKVTDVRDLRGVVEREQALLGVLITLYEPTRAMRTEAATAGVYDIPRGLIPRLQVLTIAQLLDPRGRGVAYPPVAAPVRPAPPIPRKPAAEQLPLMAQIPDGRAPRQPRMDEVDRAVPWQLVSRPPRRLAKAPGRETVAASKRQRRRAG